MGNWCKLSEEEPDRVLYLAVPTLVYQLLFGEILIQKVLQQYPVKLIVYNPELEEIQSWIT